MPDGIPLPSRARRDRLVARLLDWYDDHRRDLPWRRTRDPYAIWISEAMLQQTRVEAVVDHWRRFLARFPDVAALAAADEDDVLAMWSGLGYYRRARKLREAARVLVERHGGVFPRERDAVEALPGVGPYTAGAVLSIAYGRREALVDGNVERVLARLFDVDAERGSAGLKRAAWTLAETLVPARRPGEWNQALMELGALVCAPRAPRCDACPLARSCAARRAGTVLERPRARPRPATVDVALDVLVAERGDRMLFERRPRDGRMGGLWQLPTLERVPADESPRLFPAALPDGAPRLAPGAELFVLAHGITRHRIRASVRRARADGRADGIRFRWMTASEVAGAGRTGMTRKALARLSRTGTLFADRGEGTPAPRP